MSAEKVNLTINGQNVTVDEGTTILDAAKEVNVHIPTLCYMDLGELKFINRSASCRVCMVEVEGRPNLVPSCSAKVSEGMVVRTDTTRAIRARRMAVELLLSNHPNECFTCPKNMECDLQSLAHELGVREIKWEGVKMNYEKDVSSDAIVKDPNKCIILSGISRGFDSFVGPAFNIPMVESSCTYCGQCVAVCPTASLTEVNNTDKVWDALHNPKKHVIVQVAPAIRVAIGEMFGMDPGSIVTGKLAAALRRMGFDAVYDTDFAADLTIMEEASELVHRIKHGGVLPMLTSCCPAWVQFIEHQFPDMLDIPSSCKSPHIMFGAIAKTYYAQKHGLDPKDIAVVSVMPCIAKKAEARRPELSEGEHADVDIVVTTREISAMMKEAGIDFPSLEDEDFDKMMGESTGASVIFGTTGGVIEAAVRTAYEWLTGDELKDVEFTQLRGMEGIREGTVKIGDMDVKIGIAHGLGNARKLLECIRSGNCSFHAIEIMACPGGCIGGGGQPYHHGHMEIIKQRQEAIYSEDRNKEKRKSHENEEILKLYEEFLGKPYGKKAHELLHTTYSRKDRI